MKKEHFFYWTLVSIVFGITTFLRISSVNGYNFAFTYDQGRDFVEIHSLVNAQRPALVGPTTSINGLFLGPFWYYFNALPFLISQGDPQAIMYWQIFWYQLAGLAVAFFFRHKNNTFGLVASALFLLMPIGFYVNRLPWNANAMPMITIWFFLALAWAEVRLTKWKFFTVGLLAGVALQIEAAFGILFLPLTLLSVFSLNQIRHLKFVSEFNTIFGKTKKHVIPVISGFLLTLAPQFIYEVRHNFSMSKILWLQITGQTAILGERLKYHEIISDRITNFTNLVHNINHLHPWTVIAVTGMSILYCLIRFKKSKRIPAVQKLLSSSLILIIIAIIFYFIFPQKLKYWYIDGLSVPLILLVSLFVSETFQFTIKKITIKNLILSAFILLFLTNTLYKTIIEQNKYITESRIYHLADKSYIPNELTIIDFVYQQASNQGFWVYNYTPAIYDFQYQYLFWWYGTKKYGYQPEKITYADNVPDYIKSNTKIWTKRKPTSASSPIFLIIEPDTNTSQTQKEWLKKFEKFCLQKIKTFNWGTRVEIRTKTNC